VRISGSAPRLPTRTMDHFVDAACHDRISPKDGFWTQEGQNPSLALKTQTSAHFVRVREAPETSSLPVFWSWRHIDHS
jgi:hypothetical protein